ncbi:RNA methyltransferase [candidate division KSB1 bacterium]|nr:RNA methyltransferase [candidate division KSB1 bacterium]
MDQLSQNLLKQYRKLIQKKYRHRENKFIIEGIKLCTEALSSPFEILAMLLCVPLVPPAKISEFIQHCAVRRIPCYSIDEHALSSLSDTVNSQGVIAIVKKHSLQFNMDEVKFAVIIDSAQDPGNLGTIIRTCDWFGVDAIFLGTNTVDLYNPKVLRSTMGSIFHIPVVEDVDCLQLIHGLKEDDFTIFAADAYGDNDLYSVRPHGKIALICGNESIGIDSSLESLADHRIKIPSRGRAESLNLAVSAGIIISYMVNHA